MQVKGLRTRVVRWIQGATCVVEVEVDALVPEADPSEPCLEPETVRWLDHLQDLADTDALDELERHGTVYVRRSA